jgi:hypothetical protein
MRLDLNNTQAWVTVIMTAKESAAGFLRLLGGKYGVSTRARRIGK